MVLPYGNRARNRRQALRALCGTSEGIIVDEWSEPFKKVRWADMPRRPNVLPPISPLVLHEGDCRIDTNNTKMSLSNELFSIRCKRCGAELGIEDGDIGTRLKCCCGFDFFVDKDRKVTPIDYAVVPNSVAKFLSADEIESRRSVYREDYELITLGAPYREDLSVDQMLRVRQENIRRCRREEAKYNIGCLLFVLSIAVVFLFLSLGDKRNWWLFAYPGIFLWPGLWGCVSDLIKTPDSVTKGEERVPLARKHEEERLRDNLKAEARWIERRQKEEDERRERERLDREEREKEEVLRKADAARRAEIKRLKDESRKNDEHLANAIRNLILPFDKFVEKLKVGDGHGYEDRIMTFAKICGFDCSLVSNSADHGVDLIIKHRNLSIAIQCKFKSSANGNEAVQQVHTGKTIYRCNRAIVISNQGFTRNARKEAAIVGVELIQHNEFPGYLNKLSGFEPIQSIPPAATTAVRMYE